MTLRRSKPPRRPVYTGPPPNVRVIIATRSGGRCERCACNLAIGGGDPHHRKPRGMGGSRDPQINQPSNLVVICRPCHDHCESQRAAAIKAGWLVPSTSDPRSVPVRSRLHGVVLLDDAGSVTPIEGGGS